MVGGGGREEDGGGDLSKVGNVEEALENVGGVGEGEGAGFDGLGDRDVLHEVGRLEGSYVN